MLRGSRACRGRVHEDATRKLLPWNLGFIGRIELLPLTSICTAPRLLLSVEFRVRLSVYVFVTTVSDAKTVEPIDERPNHLLDGRTYGRHLAYIIE